MQSVYAFDGTESTTPIPKFRGAYVFGKRV